MPTKGGLLLNTRKSDVPVTPWGLGWTRCRSFGVQSAVTAREKKGEDVQSSRYCPPSPRYAFFKCYSPVCSHSPVFFLHQPPFLSLFPSPAFPCLAIRSLPLLLCACLSLSLGLSLSHSPPTHALSLSVSPYLLSLSLSLWAESGNETT